MLTARLADLELKQDDDGRGVAFPFHAGVGTAASAAVYFTLEPGVAVGSHTDSAEELLFIVEGEADATVGEERGILSAGDVALVPANVPHDVRNVGDGPLRVFGFFAGSAVVHVFEETRAPDASRLFVTGGPVPIAAPLAELAPA